MIFDVQIVAQNNMRAETRHGLSIKELALIGLPENVISEAIDSEIGEEVYGGKDGHYEYYITKVSLTDS